MEKSKVLLLIETEPKMDIFFNDWIKENYCADVLFIKVNKALRAIRKFWLRNNLPFSYLWYGDWFNKLDRFDAVVIHMSYLTQYMPKVISNKYPHIDIKCWYWNTIVENNKPIIKDDKHISYYSFDLDDCKKYNMKHNIQYYCYQDIKLDSKIINDIYFIGLNKNRENEIEEFKKQAQTVGLTCYFRIINKPSEFVAYDEIKKEVRQTKTILDINKENQVGYSLRVLESLFFEKKLITNNKTIKNAPFYNSNNIFIIGEDKYENLYKFVNSNYDKTVSKYQKDFELQTWYNNFFI